MRTKSKKNHKKDRTYSADFKENAIQLALRSPSIEGVARPDNSILLSHAKVTQVVLGGFKGASN